METQDPACPLSAPHQSRGRGVVGGGWGVLVGLEMSAATLAMALSEGRLPLEALWVSVNLAIGLTRTLGPGLQCLSFLI